MVDNDVAAVIERELTLLTPEVRGSSDQLEELLDPDFEEIGKSGHLWKRAEMIAALVAEKRSEQHSINVIEMSGRTVDPGLVLLTYITHVEGQRVRRSSLWCHSVKGVAGPAPPSALQGLSPVLRGQQPS